MTGLTVVFLAFVCATCAATLGWPGEDFYRTKLVGRLMSIPPWGLFAGLLEMPVGVRIAGVTVQIVGLVIVVFGFVVTWISIR